MLVLVLGCGDVLCLVICYVCVFLMFTLHGSSDEAVSLAKHLTLSALAHLQPLLFSAHHLVKNIRHLVIKLYRESCFLFISLRYQIPIHVYLPPIHSPKHTSISIHPIMISIRKTNAFSPPISYLYIYTLFPNSSGHLKGMLGTIPPNRTRPRTPTRNTLHDPIDIVRATPPLVGEHITPQLLLPSLHKIHIRLHSLGLKPPTQLTRHRRATMQSRERDKLDDEPLLRKIPDEALQLLLGETLAEPVEGRGEVVDHVLLRLPEGRETGLDCFGERRGEGDGGGLCFEPEEVGVGGECDGAFGRGGDAGEVVEIALAGAGDTGGPEGEGGAGGEEGRGKGEGGGVAA